MKKKNLLAVFLLATAGFFSSCSSDDSGSNNGNPTDDDNVPVVSDLIGTWKAETLSYQVGSSIQEWPFDHPSIKQGCATDYLTIKAAGVVELIENNKNVDNDCEDVVKSGSWTEQTVTISGEAFTREVISVDETTLRLKYPYNFFGQEADITVVYSKQ